MMLVPPFRLHFPIRYCICQKISPNYTSSAYLPKRPVRKRASTLYPAGSKTFQFTLTSQICIEFLNFNLWICTSDSIFTL
ncbi:hypothetical protein AQUCO_04100150v1 [Aquilegia coerulea]|uniref:Uncharacterized protein n=1 Tax=Aquilegia coerulea TaxID=218851 RepID=A0A2G5CQC2_AQUCA|nr:hypothetical protein AQUCO_04100150v1 [Aquilegia coerulea]